MLSRSRTRITCCSRSICTSCVRTSRSTESGGTRVRTRICVNIRIRSVIRHIDRRLDRVAQPVVARIRHHADDLDPPFASRRRGLVGRLVLQTRNPELMADRVALRPVLPRHGLVDHRQLRPAPRFGAIPHAPLRQRNVQHRKILGADEVHPHHRLLRFAAAQDFDPAVASVGRRRGVGRNTRRHHLRHGRDPRADLLEVFATAPSTIG